MILFWALLFLAASMLLTPKALGVAILIGMFLFIHFNMLYCIALTKHSLKKACKEVWRTGVQNLPSFIVPYTFAVIVYIILWIPMKIISNAPVEIAGSITAIIILLFFAWLRYYIYDLVQDTKKR